MSTPYFRYKPSIDQPVETQGIIYWTSRNYRRLPEEKQRMIRALCESSGGEYAEAVLEFVTTDKGATAISMRHNMSRETLDRAVKRYYEAFPMEI